MQHVDMSQVTGSWHCTACRQDLRSSGCTPECPGEPVVRVRRSRARTPISVDRSINVDVFYTTDRLRRSAARHTRTPLKGHAAMCGLTMREARDLQTWLIGWGLVTTESANRAARSVTLTTTGLDSLLWAAPPKPPDDDEMLWTSRLVASLAAYYMTTVHRLLRGQSPIACARFVYALTDRDWTPGRIQLRFGVPAASVPDHCLRWLEYGRKWRSEFDEVALCAE